MKCQNCGSEMLKGGIVTKIDAVWYPEDEFNKSKRLAKSMSNNCISLGDLDLLNGQVKLQNAYLCEKCKMVIGQFHLR